MENRIIGLDTLCQNIYLGHLEPTVMSLNVFTSNGSLLSFHKTLRYYLLDKLGQCKCSPVDVTVVVAQVHMVHLGL